VDKSNSKLKTPANIDFFEPKRWVVVRTRSRCEKKLGKFFLQTGIHFFLPLRRSIKYYQKRKAEFYIPMFTGYIFCQIDLDYEFELRQSMQVASIIRPDLVDEKQLIKDLNDVKCLIEATLDGEIVVRPEIKQGDAVMIKSGPLAGLNGIVSRWKNKTRITVNVDMVGQSVDMEVDASEIEIDY
jgi:transcriptional antiterminator RfaH